MACRVVALRSRTAPFAPPGGTWEFLGFSDSPSGIPGSGGTDPGTLTGDNPSIDVAGWDPGYYHFQYTPQGGDCVEPVTSIVWVQEQGSAGEPEGGSYCTEDDSVINLFDHLDGETAGGLWVLSDNSPDDPGGSFSDSYLDIGDIPGPGTYVFDYIVDVEGSEDFDPVDCLTCRSIASVPITVSAPCDPGMDGTTSVTGTTGSINLFEYLGGTPDIGGTWAQLSGASVSITNGHLGTVNLNSAASCEFSFGYTCPGPVGCTDTATVTVYKNPTLAVTITQDGNTLEAGVSGCGGTATLQWQSNVSGTWTNISGATGSTYSPDADGLYRVLVACQGCQIASAGTSFEQDCDCNNFAFGLALDQGTDCLEIIPAGEGCSEIDTDVLQYKKQTSGTWLTYLAPVCGCNLRDYLDVNTSCGTSGNNITFGFSSVNKCGSAFVDRIYVKYGNGTVETNSGSFTLFTKTLNAADFVNTYNRLAEFRIRLNIPGVGYIFQVVQYAYSGGTTSPSCGQLTTTKLNYPKYYHPLDVRRTVTFEDGCDPVQAQQEWDIVGCDFLFVQLTKGTQSGQPVVVATVFNDTGCSFGYTYQWYRNGTLLSGETGNTVNRNTYGEGFYEVRVTCGPCEASDTIQTSTCTVTVTVSGPASGVYTATVANCAGSKTYYWERWTGSAWTSVRTQTTTNNTDTYTPTQTGQFRVRVVCASGSCEHSATFTHQVDCTASVVITDNGTTLTATPSNCSSPSYQWQRWTGSAWNNVGTNSSTYTPTQSGLYRVIVTCANGCTAEDQHPFVIECATGVSVSGPSGGVYTATVTGCAGSKTYYWERWNGSSWQNERTQTTTNNTDTFTPSINASYRVRVVCAADGCTAVQPFEHTTSCAATVTIIESPALLTAAVSGCIGSVFYTWYYRATPGSGSWGSPIANSVSINPATWGAGEYRVDTLCGGCSATDTHIYSGCSYTLSLNCASSNPFTAVVSGCGGTVTYQWQFSPTGTGWINLGTSSTQMPTQGTGYYRVTTWCNGACPQSVTCYYESACGGEAEITADYNGCDWEVWFPVNTGSVSYGIYFNGAGSPQVSVSADLTTTGGRNSLRAAIEAFLASGGYAGSALVTYNGRGGGYIKISCTRVTLDRVTCLSHNFWAGMCEKICTYTWTIPGGLNRFLLNGINLDGSINGEGSLTEIVDWPTNHAALKAQIEGVLAALGVSGTVTINTSLRTVTIAGTPAAIGVIGVRAADPDLFTRASAVRSSCVAGWAYPTLDLDVTGCSGSQSITWQYRTGPSGAWSTVQTGGTTFFTCQAGQYRSVVVCGGCTYISNTITIS